MAYGLEFRIQCLWGKRKWHLFSVAPVQGNVRGIRFLWCLWGKTSWAVDLVIRLLGHLALTLCIVGGPAPVSPSGVWQCFASAVVSDS